MPMRNLLIALFSTLSFLGALVQTMPVPANHNAGPILKILNQDLFSRIPLPERYFIRNICAGEKDKTDAHYEATYYENERYYECMMKDDPFNYDNACHGQDGELGLILKHPGIRDKMIMDLRLHIVLSDEDLQECERKSGADVLYLHVSEEEFAYRWKSKLFGCMMERATLWHRIIPSKTFKEEAEAICDEMENALRYLDKGIGQ